MKHSIFSLSFTQNLFHRISWQVSDLVRQCVLRFLPCACHDTYLYENHVTSHLYECVWVINTECSCLPGALYSTAFAAAAVAK